MDETGLRDIIASLRNENNDNQYYEAKAAHGGMPQNMRETISAFANTPGGGALILGVDETHDFNIVGVYDPKKCQQTLANYARKEFSALIGLKSELITIGGKYVVWAEVQESDKMLKPIKIKNSGKSFIRYYDGDFELSAQEEQLFIAARGASHFDEDIIAGSNVSDLDKRLTADYVARRKAHSRALSEMREEDILFRTGVTNRTGELTKAGAAALGMYPQQFLPNYSVKVSVRKKNNFAAGVRAVNVNSIDGPIPLMLEETIKWVENNSDEITADLPNGRVRTIREYPSAAVRELVSNALIHRDMNPVSMFQNITLTIEEDRLVISNPGGLYGLSVRELGRSGSKTRNARLAEICQYIQTGAGLNVVEKLGSGIPKIIEELSESNMKPPRFVDGGIYFTAVLMSGKYYRVYPGSKNNLPDNEEKVRSVLAAGSLSKGELQRDTGLTRAQVRFILEKMIKNGHVRKLGERTSPNTQYELVIGD